MQTSPTQKGRYALLDELRGITFISMLLYHTLWDLVWLYGVRCPWYTGTAGALWQQSICWVFILLSGFCMPLGRYPLRRGAIVFASGALVTIVTLLFMPESAVWFGVLTLLGSCMLLTGLLQPVLERIPAAAGLAASALLFALTRNVNSGVLGLGGSVRAALPRALYCNYLTAYLGFPPAGFFSTDYFSLVPWLFLFWAGYYLHRAIGTGRMNGLRRSVCPPLGWVGRHTLLLYLLHQPVIYGMIFLIFKSGLF